MTSTKFDVHTAVTNNIIAALEIASAVDWKCPWHKTGGGLPKNGVTGKAYRGVNILSLWVAGQVHGYADHRWATYKQWASVGAQVHKGERSSLVVFFKKIEVHDAESSDDDGKRLVARASFAFNAEQVDGAPELPSMATGGFNPIETAETFARGTGILIRHTGDVACYVPNFDEVRMPPRDRFVSADGYYSTLFHELTHATGHRSRLDRDLTGRFKSQAYAAEELVAELGSAFLMAELGLSAELHQQHASYIASWIQLLKDDPRAIFTAASKASQAVDYMKARGRRERPTLT
jgi:antirestriction protein ArdC